MRNRIGRAWAAGLWLFALEAAQSLLLLPLLVRWLPAAEVALWVSLTAGLGLVNAAAASYSLPLVRSVAAGAEPTRLPANWQGLLARADRSGALLLLLFQALFTGVLAASAGGLDWPAAWWLALAVFLLAMQLRLAAVNRFVWLNGLGLIGQDKQLLAQASAVMLVVAMVLAHHFGSVLALSGAAVAASAVLWLRAQQSVCRLGHNPSPTLAGWPARHETLGLVALNLAGYLNLGTDVLVANHELPATQAVAYAFWSRALMISVLLAGLYTQFRFPSWVRMPAAELRRELRRCLLAAAVLPFLGWIFYAVASQRVGAWPFGQLALPTMLALAATAACACVVVVSGQISTALGRTQHLLPSALVAAAAPLLALGLASAFAAQAFVGGYLLTNVGLCAINLRHARRALNRPAA